MLNPRKLKFRKPHRLTPAPVAGRGFEVAFGEFALLSQESGWVSSRQIEAARRAMTRHIKRGGQVWIRIFPHIPVTSHGNENGMGGGKGAPDHFVSIVSGGKVLFEMGGVTEALAKEAMRLAAYKLAIKTKFIVKERGQ